MMKYCSHCGAQSPEEAAFCERCGASAGPGAPSVQPIGMKGGSRTPLVIALIALVVVAILSTAAWALFFRPLDRDTYEDRVIAATEEFVDGMSDVFGALELLDDADYDEPIGEERLTECVQELRDGLERQRSARDDLAGLRPPSEERRAHDRLIDGMSDVVEVLGLVEAQLEGASPSDTPDDIEERFESAVGNRFSRDFERGIERIEQALIDLDLDDLFDEIAY